MSAAETTVSTGGRDTARASDRSGISRSLLPVYFFVTISFVVYIPVSIFHSVLPLLILDLCLYASIAITLVARRRRRMRVLGGNSLVALFVSIYCASVVIGVVIALDSGVALTSVIRSVRSLLFGIGFLYISTIWMDDQKKVERYLQVFLWGALLVAVYGLRQRVFGLSSFELDRLSQFGSVLNEIEYEGRVRIPSTFGDPATFSFYMMIAIILFPVVREHRIVRFFARRAYVPGGALLVSGILFSLVRGPLVGLVVGFVFLLVINRKIDQKMVVSLIAGLALLAALAGLLNYYMASRPVFAAETTVTRAIDHAIVSAWSILPTAADADAVSPEAYRLKTKSVSARSSSWQEGFNYLWQHPFGGGLDVEATSSYGEYEFSPIDAGFMRYGLELGWLGLFSMVGLMCAIGLAAFRKMRSLSDPRTVAMGRRLLGVWIAAFVALFGTSFLYTEIIGGNMFIIGGILLNLDLIGRNGCA